MDNSKTKRIAPQALRTAVSNMATNTAPICFYSAIIVVFGTTLAFDLDTYIKLENNSDGFDLAWNKSFSNHNDEFLCALKCSSDPRCEFYWTEPSMCFFSYNILDLERPPHAVFSRQRTLTNLALGKYAKQISMGWGGISSRAVDGNNNGQGCTHTTLVNKPWLYVDLYNVSRITRVRLYNRDWCPERLLNFDIAVLATVTSFDINTRTRCAYHGSQVFQVQDFQCPHPGIEGRYVLVQIRATQYLTICELQAWGYVLE